MLHRSFRRLPAALVAAAALSTAAPALAGSPDAIIAECAQGGGLKPGHSAAELTAALEALPADVREYTPCVGLIGAARQALALAAAGAAGNGGGATGSRAPSGLSAGAAWPAIGGAAVPGGFDTEIEAPSSARADEVAAAMDELAREAIADREGTPIATPQTQRMEGRSRPIAPVASAAASALLLAGSGLALARPAILRRRRLAE